jgi:DNA modification methylase
MRERGDAPPSGVRADWSVPVITGWASTDDAHAEAMVVADNRLTIAGGWDADTLMRMLTDIADADADAVTGFTAEDLQELLDAAAEQDTSGDTAEEGFELPDEDAVQSRPGDIWTLGEHRLACGDATDRDLWDRLFADTPAGACVWTDPPYGVNYVGKTKRALTLSGDTPDGAIPLFADTLEAIAPHLRDGAAVYVAHPSGPLGMLFGAALDAEPYHLLQQLIWVKDAFTLGRSDYHFRHEAVYYAVHGDPEVRRWHGGEDATTVFNTPRPNANTHHPTTKPTALIRPMVVASSQANEVVVEPFSGSGATLMATVATGRTFRGTELDGGYTDVACARWQAATGRLPVRDGHEVSFAELAGQMGGYHDTPGR